VRTWWAAGYTQERGAGATKCATLVSTPQRDREHQSYQVSKHRLQGTRGKGGRQGCTQHCRETARRTAQPHDRCQGASKANMLVPGQAAAVQGGVGTAG
jgi:hypothetical protein